MQETEREARSKEQGEEARTQKAMTRVRLNFTFYVWVGFRAWKGYVLDWDKWAEFRLIMLTVRFGL